MNNTELRYILHTLSEARTFIEWFGKHRHIDNVISGTCAHCNVLRELSESITVIEAELKEG